MRKTFQATKGVMRFAMAFSFEMNLICIQKAKKTSYL